MDKFLSVIVPVYNTEKYLNKCIESIIKATNQDCEIILVNDGSKDKSGSVCDEYAKTDDRIKVIHQENLGVITARKTGVLNSTGRYITFVDSDDWVSEQMYEVMMEFAISHNADTVICDMMYETESGRFLMKNNTPEGFYTKDRLEKEFYSLMLFNFDECLPGVNPSLCNKLIKKEILEKVIFSVNDTVVYGEDALCVYPALLDAERIYVINDVGFYHYRKNTESVTNVYDEKLLSKCLILFSELKRQFSERGFDFKEQLSGYIARHSVECIRSEILFAKQCSLKGRIERIKKYIEDDIVAPSFDITLSRIYDKKTRFKMKLVKNKRFYLLYLMFYFKQMIMRKRNKK